MAKIKKAGLDYFPVDTGYMQDRLMRRIMKREGDGAARTASSAPPPTCI